MSQVYFVFVFVFVFTAPREPDAGGGGGGTGGLSAATLREIASAVAMLGAQTTPYDTKPHGLTGQLSNAGGGLVDRLPVRVFFINRVSVCLHVRDNPVLGTI